MASLLFYNYEALLLSLKNTNHSWRQKRKKLSTSLKRLNSDKSASNLYYQCLFSLKLTIVHRPMVGRYGRGCRSKLGRFMRDLRCTNRTEQGKGGEVTAFIPDPVVNYIVGGSQTKLLVMTATTNADSGPYLMIQVKIIDGPEYNQKGPNHIGNIFCKLQSMMNNQMIIAENVSLHRITHPRECSMNFNHQRAPRNFIIRLRLHWNAYF